MVVLMLGAGLCLLLLLLSLAVRLRLGIPLVYVLLMLTVFHGWYQAHTALADGILLLLVGAAALSWVVTLVRKAAEVLGMHWLSTPQRSGLSSVYGRPGRRGHP